MKIAYFTDTYYPEINGVANTLSKLHNYLKEQEISHIFFAPAYEQEEMTADIYRMKGIPIPFSPNSRLALSLPYYRMIQEELENFQPDLIHIVTEFTIGNAGLRLAQKLHIPFVTSYHTNIEQYLSFFHAGLLEKPVRAYFKKFHSQALATFCPSIQTYQQLAKQGYQNLSIWSRGVDTNLYSPAKRTGFWRKQFGKDKFICLYVGRISYEKGLDVFLEAIQKVNRYLSDKVVFLFAGDGPYRAEMEEYGIENVKFTGFVRGEMLAQLYADSDLFIFPSGTETFGNVLLEAMASGCPCICTDSGGVTDFTTHKENAFVVPYRSVDALAESIMQMTDSALLRHHLSNGALKMAHSRNWNHIMEQLINAYKEVLVPSVQKNA